MKEPGLAPLNVRNIVEMYFKICNKLSGERKAS